MGQRLPEPQEGATDVRFGDRRPRIYRLMEIVELYTTRGYGRAIAILRSVRFGSSKLPPVVGLSAWLPIIEYAAGRRVIFLGEVVSDDHVAVGIGGRL